jgi:hypothetical protein
VDESGYHNKIEVPEWYETSIWVSTAYQTLLLRKVIKGPIIAACLEFKTRKLFMCSFNDTDQNLLKLFRIEIWTNLDTVTIQYMPDYITHQDAELDDRWAVEDRLMSTKFDCLVPYVLFKSNKTIEASKRGAKVEEWYVHPFNVL